MRDVEIGVVRSADLARLPVGDARGMTRLVRLATVVAVLAGLLAASPAMANAASATSTPTKPAPAITSTSVGLPSHQPDPNAPHIALPLAHARARPAR